MNSAHYRQILETVRKFKTVLTLTDEMIDYLSQLKDLHQKYSKEVNEYLYYPRHDLSKARLLVHEIRSVCNKSEVFSVSFTKDKTLAFKKGFFAYYKIHGWDIDITDLIHFGKKEKQSVAGMQDIDEDIKNWNLNEQNTPI